MSEAKHFMDQPDPPSMPEKVEPEARIQEEITAEKFEQLLNKCNSPEEFLDLFYWSTTDSKTGETIYIEFPKYNLDEAQQEITQGMVNQYTDKYLSAIEHLAHIPEDTNQLTPTQLSSLYENVMYKLHPITLGYQQSSTSINFSDQVYSSLIHDVTCAQHELSASEYLIMFSASDPGIIHHDILYSGIADLTAAGNDPDKTRQQLDIIKSTAFRVTGWLGYDQNFSGNRFQQALSDVYHNSSPSDIRKVVHMLEAAKLLYITSGQSSLNDWGMRNTLNTVEDIAETAPNYILSKCAENTLKHINGGNRDISIRKQNYSRWKSEDAHMQQLDGSAQLQLYEKFAKPIAPGLLGIFDADGNLLKYLPQEEIGSAEPRSISSLPLFMEKADDSEADIEAKKDDVETYRLLASLPIREAVEADFGINLADIEPRTQYYFLNFLKGNSRQEAQKMMDASKEYGSDFFTAFLSLAENANMGEKLLELAELPDKALVKKLLAKYAGIANSIDNVRSFMSENMRGETIAEDDISIVTEGLLKRGKLLLEQIADGQYDPETIGQLLDDINSEIILLTEIFRIAKKQDKEITLEELNTNIEIYNGPEIGQNDDIKNEILRIFDLNWNNTANSQAYPHMSQELDDAFENPDERFYLIFHGKELLGFQRFHDEGASEVYAASNNVRESAKGAGIGALAQREILSREAARKQVKARAFSGSPAVSHYLAKDGFVATGIEEYGKSGDLDFLLVRNDKVPQHYHYQGQEIAKIAHDYGHKKAPAGIEILQLNLDDKAKFQTEIQHRLGDGQNTVITAFYRSESNPHLALIVFEPSQLKQPENTRERRAA